MTRIIRLYQIGNSLLKRPFFRIVHFSIMPVLVAVGQNGGISEIQKALNDNERLDVLGKLFPPRVLKDYERFKDKESPMLDLIPQFNRTYRLQNVIIWITKTIPPLTLTTAFPVC